MKRRVGLAAVLCMVLLTGTAFGGKRKCCPPPCAPSCAPASCGVTYQTQYQMVMALGETGYAPALPYLRELADQDFEATILYVALGFVVWLFAALAQRAATRQPWARSIVLALFAGGLAVLISAAAMLPFLELVSQGYSYKNSDLAEQIWLERLEWTRSMVAVALLHPGLLSAAQGGMSFVLWPWAQGASIGLVTIGCQHGPVLPVRHGDPFPGTQRDLGELRVGRGQGQVRLAR